MSIEGRKSKSERTYIRRKKAEERRKAPVENEFQKVRRRASERLAVTQKILDETENLSVNAKAELMVEQVWLRYGLNVITSQQKEAELDTMLNNLSEGVVAYLDERVPNEQFNRLGQIKNRVINHLTGQLDVK